MKRGRKRVINWTTNGMKEEGGGGRGLFIYGSAIKRRRWKEGRKERQRRIDGRIDDKQGKGKQQNEWGMTAE
jgi:hypothetical protein